MFLSETIMRHDHDSARIKCRGRIPSYLIGESEGEEVEAVGVPLGDDLAEDLVVAHLARPLRRRVRRLGRRLKSK